MFLLYNYDGCLLAVSRHNFGYAQVTGDVEMIRAITGGSDLWTEHSRLLADFDNGEIRTVVLPDSDEVPSNLQDALEKSREMDRRNSINRDDLTALKFDFKEYPGFGSIGPLVMERSSEVARAYLSHEAKARGHKGFDAEWAMLERYYKDLKGTAGAWESYLDEWRDDLPLGDHIVIETSADYSPSGKTNHSLLVQMGHQLWVSFENFEDYDSLSGFMFVPISCETYPDEAAAQIAFWINESGGSIAAALSVDPEFDYTGSEDDDVNALFEDFHEENVCTIDCATVNSDLILGELRKLSRDFALTELLLDPDQFGTDVHESALLDMHSRIESLRN